MYDMAQLHGATMKFFAAEAAGQPTALPFQLGFDKASSDVSVQNTDNGKSLEGGCAAIDAIR